jgi:alanine racemase
MAVVKADAYGHGMEPIATAAIEAGADRLAVALPEEGKKLRELGFELPIQVFGEVSPQQIPTLVWEDLIPTVSKEKTLDELNEVSKTHNITKKIHIKIDTGMGRIGVLPEEALPFIQYATSLSNVTIEGLITHFAKADEANKEYTYMQWERFNNVIQDIKEENITIPIKHAANSATIIDLPEMSLDMVRPGIMMYGLRPSHEVDEEFPLKPVLRWTTEVVYRKELPPGHGVSYGATYIPSEPRTIATIPVGYEDGYSRLLSNRGDVLINGERAPIRGRICMDQFMVDVTDISGVEIGDEVVLIGTQGSEEITATELADLTDTINYEIVCSISDRVPRVYV